MTTQRAYKCPICAGPRRRMYRWRAHQLYRCQACGTESVYPQPTSDELEVFYQEMSGKKMVRWEHRLDLVREAFDGYMKRYQRATAGGYPDRFLDVGGGVGYYARAALDRNIDACLVDWADDALAFTREVLDMPHTVQGDVQHCADVLEGEAFDFVLARHVIEHMLDPAELVDNLARVMRDGGLLELETPNVSSREQFGHPVIIAENYKILRASNPEMSPLQVARQALTKSMSGGNPPKHLWGFTPEGLTILLEEQGFRVLSVEQAPAGHPVYNPLYYDWHRLAEREGLGVPYYFWERASYPLFEGRGTNLAVLARWSGSRS